VLSEGSKTRKQKCTIHATTDVWLAWSLCPVSVRVRYSYGSHHSVLVTVVMVTVMVSDSATL